MYTNKFVAGYMMSMNCATCLMAKQLTAIAEVSAKLDKVLDKLSKL